MKKLLVSIVALFALIASCAGASAMSRSQQPGSFDIPWANSASCGTPYTSNCFTAPVPQSSQIGITNCAASLTDGFPPLTFTPVASGGCGPFGQDLNGILKQITQWSQWQNAGNSVVYSSAFSSAIGGYPEGAILSQAANAYCVWLSQVSNNATDPDTGGSGWTSSCPGGGIGGTSTGSANAQVVATTPFRLVVGTEITFLSGFANTGSTQINVNGAGLVNLFKQTSTGLSALIGGEMRSGFFEVARWDGTEWQLLNPVPIAPATIAVSSSPSVTTAYCGKTVIMSGGFYEVTIGAASGFPDGCIVTLINNDGRGKGLNVNGLSAVRMFPTWTITFTSNGAVWLQSPSSQKYSGTPTLYADITSGSDNPLTSDCLASGAAACATIQGAINACVTNVSPNAMSTAACTIQLDCDATQGSFQLFTALPPAHGLTFIGNPSSPTSCPVLSSVASGTIADIEDTGIAIFSGIEFGFSGGVGGVAVFSRQFSVVDASNVLFGSNPGGVDFQVQEDSTLNLTGPTTFGGNVASFIIGQQGAQVYCSSCNIIIANGTWNVSNFLNFSGSSNFIGPISFTNTGTISGTRFSCGYNATLQLGVTAWPAGLTGGTSLTGCQEP